MIIFVVCHDGCVVIAFHTYAQARKWARNAVINPGRGHDHYYIERVVVASC